VLGWRWRRSPTGSAKGSRPDAGSAPGPSMTPEEFGAAVRSALDELPPQLSAALENVAVVVVDEDPDEPDLFGLWQSVPYLPDTITICRLPLVRAFPDRRELERQIRITVLHELAHYFGLDEDRIDELGFG